MKFNFSLRIFALAIGCVLALSAQAAIAQSCSSLVPTGTPSCTQVFSAVNVRTSEATAGYTGNAGLAPDIFGSSAVNLTCSATPIIATLSGPLMNSGGTAPQLSAGALQPGGSLLVDNNLFVGVNVANGGVLTDVCTGYNQGTSFGSETVPSIEAENCFESPYAGAVGYPTIPSPINGEDPDTGAADGGTQTVDFVGGLPVTTFASGGVGSIDISGLLTNSSTPQTVTVQLQDDGGVLTSSSIFLATNCTIGPVTGPATVSGNTITTGNPNTLNQSFNFNTNTGNVVGFVYNLGPAGTANTLTPSSLAPGPIPQTADLPVDPTTFQTGYAENTSFATSNCLIHSGEALANGNPACKLYTLECLTGTGSTASGAQCPVSVVDNEVVQDIFDGPNFPLQNIYTLNGVFNEGIGLLMASDTWGNDAVPPTLPTLGGPCEFDQASGLQSLPCPQNLLISFSGPGGFGGTGLTSNPNSTFISVYGVPEDQTTVFVPGEWPDNWVSSNKPQVYFAAQAPNFSKGAWTLNGSKLVALPNASEYVPAPIQGITYGLSAAGSPTPVPANEPIAGDTTLTAVSPCPYPLPTKTSEPNFTPAPVTLGPGLADGQYLLHYYAEDCAGTQELQFSFSSGQTGWSTNFYTYPINIDTTKPTVSFTTPSPAPKGTTVLTQGGVYTQGQSVTAYYTCTDPPAAGQTAGTSSGLVLCGLNLYAPQTTYSTTLSTKISTSFVGKNQTFSVYAIDGAGNISSPGTITYTVNK